MAEILPELSGWWDGRKAALLRQIQDNLGGTLLSTLRGAARGGIDMVDQVAGNVGGAMTGGVLRPTGIADKLLPPDHTPAEGVGEFLGPPLKTGLKLATMGGILAKKAPLMAMAQAKDMKGMGADAEDIWRSTGGWVGPEGRTRFEIPDQSSKLLPMGPGQYQRSGKLGEFFDHPELYENYPYLKDMPVSFNQTPHVSGEYSPRNKSMIVSGPEETHRSTLLHEIQHTIQEYEGHTGGSSPDTWKKVMTKFPDIWEATMDKHIASQTDPKIKGQLTTLKRMGLDKDPVVREQAADTAYTITGGEVESRNTEKRLENSATENRLLSPESTMDTPPVAWLLKQLALPGR